MGECECTESSRYELFQTKHKTCTLYARVSALKREVGERDRQTDRQTETERDRDREETDTERGQQTNRDREGHRVRERESNFVMDGKSD